METTVKLMKITQEYIKNLMTDSKNRRKYELIYNKISKYIQSADDDNLLTDEDNFDMDDPIGTIFERLLKIAIFYEPLNHIGPMYLCWILENRLLKLDKDPDAFNYSLNNNMEELFPYKSQWRENSYTASNASRVHLFDSICKLFQAQQNNISIALSSFLFERTMPCYFDFLLHGDKSCSNGAITHQYVTYSDYSFSSTYLPTALSAISDMLWIRENSFPLKFSADKKAWYACNNGISGKQYLILPLIHTHCFLGIDMFLRSRKDLLKIFKSNEKEFLKTFQTAIENKPGYEDFIKLALLNPNGYRNIFHPLSNNDVSKLKENFTCWLISCLEVIRPEDIIIPEKIPERSVISPDDRDDIEYLSCKYIIKFVQTALSLLYSGYFREDLFKQLILLSKESYFSEDFTDEQYQRLQDFSEEFCQYVMYS